MKWSKEHAVKFVGKYVHCHSVYGMHAGMVHRALRDGIILVNHVQLASGQTPAADDIQTGLYANGDSLNLEPVFGWPGMFIPYGGLFGLWPRPFII